MKTLHLLGLSMLIAAVANGIIMFAYEYRPAYRTTKPVAEEHAKICAPSRSYWTCLERLGYEITTEFQ